MAPIKKAIDLMLTQQEPFGAIVVDRLWNVLQMNQGALRMMGRFMAVPPDDPRIAGNVIRATMHPAGLRPAIVNWVEVAVFLLERMDHECAIFPHDEERLALRDEVRGYPGVAALQHSAPAGLGTPVALVHMKRGDDEARLFTMVTTLGTPLDITAQDLAIESYFPADEATEAWLRGLSA